MNLVPQWSGYCPETGKLHSKAYCKVCGALDPHRPRAFPRNTGLDRESSILIESSSEESADEKSGNRGHVHSDKGQSTPSSLARSDVGRFSAAPRPQIKSNESRKVKDKSRSRVSFSSKGEANAYRQSAIRKQQDQDKAMQRRHAGKPAVEGLQTQARPISDWLEPDKTNSQPMSYEVTFWILTQIYTSYTDSCPVVESISKTSSGESD